MAPLIAGPLPASAQQTAVPREEIGVPGPSTSLPAFVLPQSAPATPPAGAEAVTIDLREIVVEGATAISETELREIYAEDLGRTVTLARLFEITGRIEAEYRNRGYVLTRAIIPAQTIEGGVFRIQVIEGFVGNVVLEGDVGPVRALVEAYARKITAHRPVNIADIERYLLLINDIPGITARGVPRPGAGEVGASELVIVLQRKWYEGFAFVDNRGSRFLGPVNAALGGALNAFTPWGEQAKAVLFGAPGDREQVVGQIVYQQAVGTEGMRVGGFATYGLARPGDTLEPLDVDADTLLLNGEIEYPVTRTRRLSLWVNGGFDYVDGETDVLNAPFSEDKLRVIYGGGRVEFRDELLGSNLLLFRIRRGLDILGATDRGDGNRSRIDGEADFTTVSARFSRAQHIVDRLSLYARVEGQYAFDPLLVGEEFALGGLTYGRGYDPAELTGEHGVGLSLELRYAIPDVPALQWLELYGFYDYGRIWNRDNAPDTDSLSSAGAGARMDLTDWLSVAFEAAKPLTKELQNRGGNPWRFFFNVTARF